MNSMELVRFAPTASRPIHGSGKRSRPPFCGELLEPARQAILRARQSLIADQRRDGGWIGQQTTDASLPSRLIFLLTYFRREKTTLAERCAARILQQQGSDGGWSRVPGGAADVSTSIEAYFALKLTGLDPTDERIVQAREVIRNLGGADAASSSTRLFLAMLGQVDYDYCVAMPPERLLFVRRAERRFVPLSIIWSHRPVRDVGIERGIRELFIEKPCDWPKAVDRRARSRFPQSLRSFVDFASRFVERRGWTPLRRRGLRRAESQILRQIERTHIVEPSFEELVWDMLGLHSIGYEESSTSFRLCEDRLREMVQVDDENDSATPLIRSMPAVDTAIALRSLVESGLSGEHPAIAAGMSFLSDRIPSFDSVGTNQVCGVIQAIRAMEPRSLDEQAALPADLDIWCDWSEETFQSAYLCEDADLQRILSSAIELLLKRQNPDGGWSAACPTNGKHERSDPVVTGSVLESLQNQRGTKVQTAVHRACEFLRTAQRANGGWTGASELQRIQSTSFAVRGLVAAGVSSDDAIGAGINWLVVHQQTSGGWGDVSQTAWALLAIVAAGKANHPAALRGVECLLDAQDEEGHWVEDDFVHFDAASNRWFGNDLHAVAWPLLALSRWAVAASSAQSEATNRVSLRLAAAPTEV